MWLCGVESVSDIRFRTAHPTRVRRSVSSTDTVPDFPTEHTSPETERSSLSRSDLSLTARRRTARRESGAEREETSKYRIQWNCNAQAGLKSRVRSTRPKKQSRWPLAGPLVAGPRRRRLAGCLSYRARVARFRRGVAINSRVDRIRRRRGAACNPSRRWSAAPPLGRRRSPARA